MGESLASLLGRHPFFKLSIMVAVLAVAAVFSTKADIVETVSYVALTNQGDCAGGSPGSGTLSIIGGSLTFTGTGTATGCTFSGTFESVTVGTHTSGIASDFGSLVDGIYFNNDATDCDAPDACNSNDNFGAYITGGGATVDILLTDDNGGLGITGTQQLAYGSCTADPFEGGTFPCNPWGSTVGGGSIALDITAAVPGTTTSAPEPGSLSLLGVGLGVLGLATILKRRNALPTAVAL